MIIYYRAGVSGKLTAMLVAHASKMSVWIIDKSEPYKPDELKDQFSISRNNILLLDNEIDRQIVLGTYRFGEHEELMEYKKKIKKLISLQVPFFRISGRKKYQSNSLGLRS